MAEIYHNAEYPQLQHGDQLAAEDRYTVYGTESESEVEALAVATLPVLINVDGSDLILLSYKPMHQGGGVWEVEARYGEKKRDGSSSDSGDAGTGTSWSFKITAQSQHITQAKFRRQAVRRGGLAAPNHKNAIGYNDGKVDGIDLPLDSGFHWTETKIISASQITLGYLKTLRDLLLTINDDTFRGQADEEVLYLGSSGQSRDAGRFELTYEFAGKPSLTDVEIGDIPAFNTKGWDIIDLHYVTEIDANFLVMVPDYLFVYRIFDKADFGQLGIGTGGTP